MDCPRCRLVNPDEAERCDCGYDFASGEMKGSYLEADEARRRLSRTPDGPYGIAGWLLVPAFGLLIGIPVALLQARDSLRTGDPGELTALGVGIAVIAVAAVGFFQKRRWAPRAYVALLAFNVLGTALPAVLTRGSLSRADGRDLARAAIAAAIWIPYFLVSKRVRNTFAD